MEQGAGIADKAPDEIWSAYNLAQACQDLAELRNLIPSDLTHKLDNWLSVWGKPPASAELAERSALGAPRETQTISPSEVGKIEEVLDVSDHSA
jgi:hypothetical protein